MISNNFNLIIILVAAFATTSSGSWMQCYECTEYNNRHEGQTVNATDKHLTGSAIGERSLNKLCHGLTGIYNVTTLVDCYDNCVYAVVQSDEDVYVTYRACQDTLKCDNFKSPIPGANVTSCKTCSTDRCNYSEPSSAVSNGVSTFFLFISFLYTYINVIS